jgi:hypothetical protein
LYSLPLAEAYRQDLHVNGQWDKCDISPIILFYAEWFEIVVIFLVILPLRLS